MWEGGREAEKGCAHGDNNQTSQDAVRTVATSQAAGCVTPRGGSSIPTLPSSARDQHTLEPSNEGRALLRAWKPKQPGWLRCGTCQSDCA